MSFITKFFIVLFFSLSFKNLFSLYELPQNLINEYKYLKSEYENFPTSNQACFDFAMVCAYTGDIEYGFNVLKRVDISFANTVISQNIKLIQSDGNEWRYYFKLAFGYYFIQNHDLTINTFKEVLNIDPNHIWAMAFISFVYGEQGDYDECLFWAYKALQIEPDAAALHFLVANAYKLQGKYFKAARYFVSCVRLRTAEQTYRSSVYE